MEKIEERAKAVLAQHTNQPTAIDLYSKDEVLEMLVEIATEQKAIDDAELHQRFEKILNGQKWDLIDKACNVLCHTGCPHKTDSFDCLNNKCDTWKTFKRMLEE